MSSDDSLLSRAVSRTFRMRRFRLNELAELAALDRKIFEPRWTKRRFESAVVQDGNVIDVAYLTTVDFDEVIVGYLVTNRTEDEVEIVRFGVHPEVRRRGVGRSLVENAAFELFDAGKDRFWTLVHERHTAALLCLRRCGYKAIRTVRKPWQHNDDDAIEMELTRSGWIGGQIIERVLAGDLRAVDLE